MSDFSRKKSAKHSGNRRSFEKRTTRIGQSKEAWKETRKGRRGTRAECNSEDRNGDECYFHPDFILLCFLSNGFGSCWSKSVTMYGGKGGRLSWKWMVECHFWKQEVNVFIIFSLPVELFDMLLLWFLLAVLLKFWCFLFVRQVTMAVEAKSPEATGWWVMDTLWCV